jgi:tetratricopeptide (TPR) repeat protein
MLDLSNKMRMLYGSPVAQRDVMSSIMFGSTEGMARFLDLNRARVRVGVWPIQSNAEPEAAMGIATVLALLLENYQEVEVYRLFAQLDGHPGSFQWSLQQSQFHIDDWQLDALGENVAIWGTLEKTAEGWSLQLQIENDVFEDEEPKLFNLSAKSLGELTARLPNLVKEIAEFLEATKLRPLSQQYGVVEADDAVLIGFYKRLFHWELKLLLMLWGQKWSNEAIVAARKDLLEAAKAEGGEFGAWAISRAVGRAMLPGFQPVGEALISFVPEVVEAFADYTYPSVVLAVGLYRLNYRQEAFDLLEESVETRPQELISWLALAELYLSNRQLSDMINTFQRALEEITSDTPLYLRYAEMLRLLAYENYPLSEFMLIVPDDFDRDTDLVRFEMIEAYEEVLKLEPEHEDALYQQLLQMAEVMDERFWGKFEKLVAQDKTGEKVRQVVDSLYNFEDVDDGINALKTAIERDPNRYDLHVNLAALYLFVEKSKSAGVELEKAKQLTQDEVARADIDRMMLSVDDPEFEAYLGELTDLVNAGSELDIEDVEYLEDIVEKAPRFAEIYALLGRAYIAWDEPSTALETLLDGQKQVPNDPDILELLGRVLWEQDQRELALEYLNKGLALNASHIPLLTRMGRCLFDKDEVDASKAYLLRAEAINPRHPALNETRLYISRMLEANEDEED